MDALVITVTFILKLRRDSSLVLRDRRAFGAVLNHVMLLTQS